MGRGARQAQAILNGAIGDYLHATNNALAIAPSLEPPIASGPRIVVLAYGLMCSEDAWTLPDGTDYGTLLERDRGYAPLYLRYNTGRAIADSGADLARLLDDLCAGQEIAEIAFVGFSMGGLVVRSACHAGSTRGMDWVRRVTRAFYVGAPHLGSPWERAGRTLTRILHAVPDPVVNLVGEIADLRSAGMKDLGDPAHPFPLLPHIRHHLVASYLDARIATLFGDGMVPLDSGTDGTCKGPRALPPEHVRILPGVAHMKLANHPEVYEHIRGWCA